MCEPVYTSAQKYLFRRLMMNGSLDVRSAAVLADRGSVVDADRSSLLVDLYDEAIQLWQSEKPYTRAGTWPSDAVIDRYVKKVRRVRERSG